MATKLPEEFTQRLAKIIPANQLTNCLDSFSKAKATSFRVNTLLAEQAETLELLTKENIKFTPITEFTNVFFVEPDQHLNLVNSTAFKNHWIYIQNISSMLPPLILNPQPQEKILDLTASPGSKTLQIAALMQNQGEISAVEKIKTRFFHLQKNLKENGATIVKTYLKDGIQVGRYCENQFDKVLLDAPCSSESRFSTLDPESYAFWNLKKIKEMQSKQKQLLFSAFRCLKPGGVLVYSTCSYAPEENELVINRLLKKHAEAEILPIELPIKNSQSGLTHWKNKSLHPAVQHCLRILPNEIYDGFFITKLFKHSKSLS